MIIVIIIIMLLICIPPLSYTDWHQLTILLSHSVGFSSRTLIWCLPPKKNLNAIRRIMEDESWEVYLKLFSLTSHTMQISLDLSLLIHSETTLCYSNWLLILRTILSYNTSSHICLMETFFALSLTLFSCLQFQAALAISSS